MEVCGMGGTVAYKPEEDDRNFRRKINRERKTIDSYKVPNIIERIKLYRRTPQFRNLMLSDVFTLVEGKYCLRDLKYIEYIDGKPQLTEYANEHFNECCVLFTYEYQITLFDNGEDGTELVGVHYLEGKNTKIILQANHPEFVKQFIQYYEDMLILEGGSEPPETFSSLLKFYMKKKGVTEEELAERTGISVRTIQRMRNEEIHYRLTQVVAICIALHLDPIVSNKMVMLSGNIFQNTKQDQMYKHLLDVAYEESVMDCNMILNCCGLKPLSDL